MRGVVWWGEEVSEAVGWKVHVVVGGGGKGRVEREQGGVDGLGSEGVGSYGGGGRATLETRERVDRLECGKAGRPWS